MTTCYRNYDPTIGRFVGVDPQGESADITGYQYAGNNPISFNDPLGDLIKYAPPYPSDALKLDQPSNNIHPSSGPLDPNWQDQGGFSGNSGTGDGPYAAFWNAAFSLAADIMSGTGSNDFPINISGSTFRQEAAVESLLSSSQGQSILEQAGNNVTFDGGRIAYWTQGDSHSDGAVTVTGTRHYLDAGQGWPFSSKSDPASWVFTTAGSNKNVQTAGVSGIDFSRYDIRYNHRNDDLTIIAVHIRLPTLYFEYPKITNMFFKKNEVLSSTFAALIMARATDRALDQLRSWFDEQESPQDWSTQIQFMKYLIEQVVRDGGRVTPAPSYAPVIVTPYKKL